MTYSALRDSIEGRLRSKPEGSTWAQLRADLELPYERACPAWTQRLEREIGLVRERGAGRALVWRLRG